MIKLRDTLKKYNITNDYLDIIDFVKDAGDIVCHELRPSYTYKEFCEIFEGSTNSEIDQAELEQKRDLIRALATFIPPPTEATENWVIEVPSV